MNDASRSRAGHWIVVVLLASLYTLLSVALVRNALTTDREGILLIVGCATAVVVGYGAAWIRNTSQPPRPLVLGLLFATLMVFVAWSFADFRAV